MPPKVNNEKILAKLEIITTQLAGLESVPKRLEALERELKQANNTNKQLTPLLKGKDAETITLKTKVNSIKQYSIIGSGSFGSTSSTPLQLTKQFCLTICKLSSELPPGVFNARMLRLASVDITGELAQIGLQVSLQFCNSASLENLSSRSQPKLVHKSLYDEYFPVYQPSESQDFQHWYIHHKRRSWLTNFKSIH
jgi:hypothetical protein